MINHFTKVVAMTGFLALGLTACKKDEVRTTAEFGAEPALSGSTVNAGVLLRANRTNPSVSYTWTPYVFKLSDNTNSDSPVTYTLQFAKAGTGFAKPYDLAAGTGTAASLALTVGQLNAAMITLRAPLTQVSALDVRLKTFVASNQPIIYSNTTTISATPYDECVAPNNDIWSLVGPAGPGWSSDAVMTWSCPDNAYVLRQALTAGEFKFRQNRDWPVNLGATTPSPVITPVAVGGSALALVNNGGNLSIATAGTYTVKLTVNGTGARATAGTVTISQ